MNQRLLFQGRRLGASGGAEFFNKVKPLLFQQVAARLQLLVGAPLGGAGGDVAFVGIVDGSICGATLSPLLHQLRRWGDS